MDGSRWLLTPIIFEHFLAQLDKRVYAVGPKPMFMKESLHLAFSTDGGAASNSLKLLFVKRLSLSL
jgi:hypothetical protein